MISLFADMAQSTFSNEQFVESEIKQIISINTCSIERQAVIPLYSHCVILLTSPVSKIVR